MSGSRKYWIRFEKSGKLSDYLTFCEERRRERTASSQGALEAEPEERQGDQSSL